MTTQQILDNDPEPRRTFPSERAYRMHNKKLIRAAGETPYAAKYDAGGNCKVCGECGRCPGYHTLEEQI